MPGKCQRCKECKLPLCCASSADELANLDAAGKIILLHGGITKEQLMPKNFIFYNPDEHKQIVALLEKSGAAALVTATSRNPELAGGMYPFPMIEDGDFDIPSVYMKDTEGEKLAAYSGQEVFLTIGSERVPSSGCNVIASKGGKNSGKIVVCAHIDSKKGTPGAIDNATGIVVLLLLAGLLHKYDGKLTVELIAFNGEDYYGAPGQMDYIKTADKDFSSIVTAVNLDGAGYFSEDTALSFYNCPQVVEKTFRQFFFIPSRDT